MIHTLVLPMPSPMKPANAYLVEGDPLTLVDTGPKSPHVLAALRAALASRGYQLADVEQVIVTHSHMDHFGMARQIVEHSGARVLAHAQGIACLTGYEAEQSRLRDLSASRLRKAQAPEVAWGILRLRTSIYTWSAESVPATCVAPLEDGQVLSLDGLPWHVLSTPGHCLGHICLYEAGSGRLISGDCLLPEYGYVPVPYPLPDEAGHAGQVAAFAGSLERIAGLDVREVLPGHGARSHDAGALVRREQAHLFQARERLLAALAKGRQTAYELWQECAAALGCFDVVSGIEVVMAYLDALQDDGAAASFEEEDRVTYGLAL